MMKKHTVDLLGCSLLGMFLTLVLVLFFEIKFEVLILVLLPKEVSLFFLSVFTLFYVLFNIGLGRYMNEPESVSNRPAWFFVFQPTAEEFLFRYNSFIVLNSGFLDWQSIALVFLIQLFNFIALHTRSYKGFLLSIFTGTMYFWVGFLFGMIPICIGHTAYNLTLYMLSEGYKPED